MKSGTAVFEEAHAIGSRSPDLVANRPGLFPLLVLSAWCGLVAGLLEVGAIVLRKRMLESDHLYWMSRHFVWLIPSINLAIFLRPGRGLVGPGLVSGAVAAVGSPRGSLAR